MRTVHYLSLSVVFFLLNTMITAQKSVFDIELSNPNKLPSLNIIIDENDIAKAYLSRQIVSGREIYNNEVEEQYFSSFHEDQKINDTKNLFNRYITDHLTEYNKNKQGSIDINVLYYNYKSRPTAGFAINVFTFGVGYIIGIPYATGRTDIELEMKIYDINNNLLKTYYGSSRDRYLSGIFYRKDERISNLEALKKAIKNINEQMIADFQFLYDLLLSANNRDNQDNYKKLEDISLKPSQQIQ